MKDFWTQAIGLDQILFCFISFVNKLFCSTQTLQLPTENTDIKPLIPITNYKVIEVSPKISQLVLETFIPFESNMSLVYIRACSVQPFVRLSRYIWLRTTTPPGLGCLKRFAAGAKCRSCDIWCQFYHKNLFFSL